MTVGRFTLEYSARHVLNVAILRSGLDLPFDGWEHYATTMGDCGGAFHYDREDGRVLVVVTGGPEGHALDLQRSILQTNAEAHGWTVNHEWSVRHDA